MTESVPRSVVADHAHAFADGDWPFADAVNTSAFTTVGVLEAGLPILEVYHDHDGDWQFLCGTTNTPTDGRLICMGCACQREPALCELADLPFGWMAWRDSVETPWQRSAYDSCEDDEA